MPSRVHWCDWLLLLAVFAATSAWCLTASPHVGITFDETNYVANGLERRRTGSYYQLMRQGTMPLPIDVTSLPVYLLEQSRDAPLKIETNSRSLPVVTDDIPNVIHVARRGTLFFWGLLLLYGFLIARSIGGPWAGRLALVLLAVEPNFLGHTVLATTDTAVTACTLAFAFHFARGRQQRALHRLWIPGLWYGFAMLAKASALVFGPLCMFAIELHRWITGPRETADDGTLAPVPIQRGLTLKERWRASKPFQRDFWRIFGIGMLLLFVYIGSDFEPEPSFLKWAQGLEEGAGKSVALFFAENLRIFPNAGNGLAYQIKHNMRGHGTFILGEAFPRAKWYYFPVALSMKLTLPVIFLLLAVVLTRARALLNWALFAAALLLLFSINYRVQIGIRMVFPGMAMLIIGLSCAAVVAVGSFNSPKVRTAFASFLGALAAWSIIIACFAWPDGIRYINELWGGPRHGYRLLSDSNYDWGQGLPALDDWRREQGIDRIDLWAFTTDPAQHGPQYHRLELHIKSVTNPSELAAKMQTDYLAVSTTLLYGSYSLPPKNPQSPRWDHVPVLLRQMEPVAQTSTFLIFRKPSLAQP